MPTNPKSLQEEEEQMKDLQDEEEEDVDGGRSPPAFPKASSVRAIPMGPSRQNPLHNFAETLTRQLSRIRPVKWVGWVRDVEYVQ